VTIAKHTVANVLGGITPLAVALLTVPAFLRYVGPERYGVLAVLWALLAYFTFFDFGFGRAVSQRMSKLSEASEAARSDLLWTAMAATAVLGIIGSVVLALSADFLLTHVVQVTDSGRKEAAGAISWLLLALPVVLLGSVLRGALVARLCFVELNAIEVLTSVLTQTLPLAAASAGFMTLDVLVPVTLCSRLLSTALLFWRCVHRVPVVWRPRFRYADAIHLLQYGGWVLLISLVTPLLVTIDRVVIAAAKGAEFVPSYTIPFDLVTKVMIVTTAVSGAIFPRLAAADRQTAQEMAHAATEALVAIMTPIVICGIFLATPFLHMWMGKGFALSSLGVPEVLLVGIWLNTIGAAQQSRLLGADKPRRLALIYLAEVPVYLALLWLGIRYGNLVGAATAWSLRTLIDTCIVVVLAGCVARTLAHCIVPGLLVVSSLVAALATAPEEWSRWFAAMLLVALALFTGRARLLAAISLVRGKPADVGTSACQRAPASAPLGSVSTSSLPNAPIGKFPRS
jgi:O-antigen/teichoic acid export membrane protein